MSPSAINGADQSQAPPDPHKRADPSPTDRLEPTRLPDHIDALYRAACALCGSRHDAEDLVQETFAQVLKRPRFVHRDHELRYLLRALRNTFYSRHRSATRRPMTVSLPESQASAVVEPRFSSVEVMQAIASAPPPFRDAVIAVDVVGLSYREAAKALRTREATITSRLHRGRQHVAQALIEQEAI